MSRDKSRDSLNSRYFGSRPIPVNVALSPVNFALGLCAICPLLPAKVALQHCDSVYQWSHPGRYRTLGGFTLVWLCLRQVATHQTRRMYGLRLFASWQSSRVAGE